MARERNTFEQTGADVVEYAKLRMDSVKLSLVDHLSTLSSIVFGVILCVILAGTALLFLAAAALWGLATLIGSFTWAALIIAFLLLAAAAIVFILRDKLIVNTMVRTFVKVFFEKTHKNSCYE